MVLVWPLKDKVAYRQNCLSFLFRLLNCMAPLTPPWGVDICLGTGHSARDPTTHHPYQCTWPKVSKAIHTEAQRKILMNFFSL